jgi:hypothetical protein
MAYKFKNHYLSSECKGLSLPVMPALECLREFASTFRSGDGPVE